MNPIPPTIASLLRRIPRAVRFFFPLCICLLLGPPARAADDTQHTFDVPAGPAGTTLKQFARQAGREIMFPHGNVESVQTRALKGRYTVQSALNLLLAETDLRAFEDGKTGALVVQRRDDPNERRATPADGDRPTGRPLRDEPTGVVGSAIDRNTGGYLPGVRIAIEGTPVRGITDGEGRFRLTGLAPGSYTLQGSYIGYEPVTVAVTVPESGLARADIVFGQEVLQLSKLVVEGYREGRAKALQQKRTATNLSDLVSADSVGNLPDRNVADAVARLPGVTLLADSGEGRFVSIRGLNPNLNNVTLNGATLASPGIRNLDGRDSVSGSVVPLDVIGSAQITQLEVIKTLTPDMDASAIGGTVNLRTASAFDRQERFIYGSLTGGYSDLARDSIYEGDVTYGNRFGRNGDVGVALSANFSRRPFRTEAFQTVWATAPFSNGQLVPLSLELLPETAKRERTGLTTNFEYRPDDGTAYYLRAVYNGFDEDNDRQEAITRTNNSAGAYTGPQSVLFNNSRGERRVYRTLVRQKQLNLAGGAKWTVGELVAEPEISYSSGRERRPEQRNLQFRNANIGAAPGFAIDFSDFALAVDRGTGTWGSPAAYVFRQADESDVGADEDVLTGKFDLTWQPDRLFGRRVTVKTGVKYLHSTRSVNVTLRRFTGSFTLADTGAVGPGQSVLGNSTVFDIDYETARTYLDAHRGELVYQEGASLNGSVSDSFRVRQDIYAAYLMATAEVGRLTLIGGARFEGTSASISAFEYRSTGSAIGTIVPNDADFRFDNFLPNLQGRWELGRNLILRAAVTSSIRRPEYEFAAPAATLNFNNLGNTGIIVDPVNYPNIAALTIGNPDLKPYESTNFDLSLEYYLKSGGLLSAAVFHKIVDNPIYQIIETRNNVIYNELGFQELQVSTYENADKGKITGLELAVQLPLVFLPSPLDGLGVDANLTLISSSVTVFSRPDAELSFFEQPDRAANVSVYYQKGRLTARVAYSYQSASLRQLNANPLLDAYRADHYQTDVQASFRLTEHLTAFANVQNLTDQPQDTYSGDPARMRYRRNYGWNARAGVRFRF